MQILSLLGYEQQWEHIYVQPVRKIHFCKGMVCITPMIQQESTLKTVAQRNFFSNMQDNSTQNIHKSVACNNVREKDKHPKV